MENGFQDVYNLLDKARNKIIEKLKKVTILIPSVLIQNTEASTLTNNTLKHIKNINIFIVENIKN